MGHGQRCQGLLRHHRAPWVAQRPYVRGLRLGLGGHPYGLLLLGNLWHGLTSLGELLGWKNIRGHLRLWGEGAPVQVSLRARDHVGL